MSAATAPAPAEVIDGVALRVVLVHGRPGEYQIHRFESATDQGTRWHAVPVDGGMRATLMTSGSSVVTVSGQSLGDLLERLARPVEFR